MNCKEVNCCANCGHGCMYQDFSSEFWVDCGVHSGEAYRPYGVCGDWISQYEEASREKIAEKLGDYKGWAEYNESLVPIGMSNVLRRAIELLSDNSLRKIEWCWYWPNERIPKNQPLLVIYRSYKDNTKFCYGIASYDGNGWYWWNGSPYDLNEKVQVTIERWCNITAIFGEAREVMEDT